MYRQEVVPTFLGNVEAIVWRHFLDDVRHQHLTQDVVPKVDLLHGPFEGQLGTFMFRFKKTIYK